MRRAHADGLRVAAHVETAQDFGLAVDMSVDIIAHLPGYNITRGRSAPEDTVSYRISEADARRAAERGVVVIPTPLVPSDTNAVREWARDFQAGQLRRLHLAGVPLVIGSDTYGSTPLPEVKFLQSLDVFSHAELLEMWGRRTAEVIFPGRRLGRLVSGYEASFLVLDCDPVADFACTQNIRLRIKRGGALNLPESETTENTPPTSSGTPPRSSR